jgi:hypothetical protein
VLSHANQIIIHANKMNVLNTWFFEPLKLNLKPFFTNQVSLHIFSPKAKQKFFITSENLSIGIT